MKVAVGSDHAGLPAKLRAVETLKQLGCEVEDVGTNGDASCDYPDYAVEVAHRVATRRADLGVLCCGTGIGMSITANKVPGIRAALCHSDFTAEMARRHNDANVLCFGGRVLDERMIDQVVRRFVGTPFDGGRHTRRLRKIADLERLLPPPPPEGH
ncbi:MAG TPA: ribose 5-phosphate isomerase B [Planctomycetota bacterium]|nr:ribose 5-phosphate isomerase B [Planctomycetota bacterium]